MDSEAARPPDVADDEDRATAQPVDPHAGRQAEQDERQELDRRRAARPRTASTFEHGRRDQREREQADLRPELADRLGRPQLQEVGVAEEACGVGRSRRRSLAAVGVRCATRRRRRCPSGRRSIVGVLVESVPNVSEGRRLDVVDRLADAIAGVPGVYLLDRTSDASHNRSVFTLAGEHEAGDRGPRAARRGGDPRDRHGRATPASTRGSGRSTSSRSSRSATTTMDDCVELARAFGERLADAASTCRSTSTPRPRRAPTGSSSPTSGAASTRA